MTTFPSAQKAASQTYALNVGDGHVLNVETYGNPSNIPVLFLHGGPGSGCGPAQRKIFDPNLHYAIFVDQRGAGKSTPKGSRIANTTQHLVNDLEQVRALLNLDTWYILGGSWGSTLALAYAQQFPLHVSGIILRSTFFGTSAEMQWALIDAPSIFYPLLHQDFLSILSPQERIDPLGAYYARILGDDEEKAFIAAWAWHDTERTLSEIAPSQTRLDFKEIRARHPQAPSTPFMEAHYFSHNSFMTPNQLTDNAHLLRDIPGIIIQGQYDLLCPPKNSQLLAQNWQNCTVKTVKLSGHNAFQPEVLAALKTAVHELTSA